MRDDLVEVNWVGIEEVHLVLAGLPNTETCGIDLHQLQGFGHADLA